MVQQQQLDTVIVGAGAAGLTAGHTLIQKFGWDIRILEASSRIGGRVRKLDNFTDFPVDLGAGWIHVDPSVLDEIDDDPSVQMEKDQIIDYDPDPYYYYYWTDGGECEEWGKETWPDKITDHVWINSTWFDFFDTYINPGDDSIELNCVVQSIDARNDTYIETKCVDGRSFRSNTVLVTVSIGVLQQGDIDFLPALPDYKQHAIDSVWFMPGLKAFFSFSDRFYDSKEAFDYYINEDDLALNEDRFFFDGTYGELGTDADSNILGFFITGNIAKNLVQMNETAIKDYILDLLDDAFDGQASKSYEKHVIQNWSQEPFIEGTYSDHDKNNSYDQIEPLLRPLADNRIFFAGEALREENGYAHGAALSGKDVAQAMASCRQSMNTTQQRNGPCTISSASWVNQVSTLNLLITFVSIIFSFCD